MQRSGARRGVSPSNSQSPIKGCDFFLTGSRFQQKIETVSAGRAGDATGLGSSLEAPKGCTVDLLAKLIVGALFVGALWWLLQPRYVFVVRVHDGVPRVHRGLVTTAFLQELGRVCAEAGVSRGWIGGVRRGRRPALAFSRNIPPPCQQRLRNLWLLQG
jgi:Protein of unknown function (DUF3634)